MPTFGIVRFRRFRQWGRYNTKYFWKLQIARDKQRFPDQPLPALIKNLGVKLEDPNHPDFPRKTSLDPIELNHPAWPKKAPPQSHPWYREVPGYLYTGADPLAEGTNHALAISKAVIRQGLPESILKAADWLKVSTAKETVEQLILHSQRWDATMEVLPERRDPILWWRRWPIYYGIPLERKNELLLDNLYRFTQVEGVRNSISEFKNRRYVRTAPINVVFNRHDKTICIDVTPQLTVSHSDLITPAADPNEVEGTTSEELADIRPVQPTIDLKLTNIFNPNVLTPFSWSSPKQIVHTVFINKVNDLFYPWSAHELTGHAVLSAFAAALSSAKSLFPEATGRLPKPVTAQCVQCCNGIFEFVVFQLNTMDLLDDSGTKNIAFVDASNKLFSTQEHWKPYDAVTDYNPEVLRKFVALLSNSVRK